MASLPSQNLLGASVPYQPSSSQSQPTLSQSPVVEGSSEPCNSFHSFASLPPELRHKIWKLSFTPRLICLHINQRLPPRPIHQSWYKMSKEQQRIHPKEMFEMDAQLSTISISFKSTVVEPSMKPSAAFHTWAELAATNPKKATTKPCPGIPAFYVCQESRMLAKQAYTLAFPGTDISLQGEDLEEWEKNDLASPKIWVDFKNDVIFLDGIYRAGVNHKCAPVNPIGLLEKYAKEETKKIARLAIGTSSTWNFLRLLRSTRPDVNYINQMRTRQQLQSQCHHIRTLLCSFETLEELLIERLDPETPPESPALERVLLDTRYSNIIAESVDSIRDAIAREFEREISNGPEQWPSGIPIIKILRGRAQKSTVV